MRDAKDLAQALRFIERHAETPEVAMGMVASMIDGTAGWTDLTPLVVTTEEGESLISVDGNAVHIHHLLCGVQS